MIQGCEDLRSALDILPSIVVHHDHGTRYVPSIYDLVRSFYLDSCILMSFFNYSLRSIHSSHCRRGVSPLLASECCRLSTRPVPHRDTQYRQGHLSLCADPQACGPDSGSYHVGLFARCYREGMGDCQSRPDGLCGDRTHAGQATGNRCRRGTKKNSRPGTPEMVLPKTTRHVPLGSIGFIEAQFDCDVTDYATGAANRIKIMEWWASWSADSCG